MIGTAPGSALEAIRANGNQISGLVKHAGTEMVDVVLVILLDQIFSLTLSPVANLQPFAVMIRRTFWDLRFEEIQYVLSKGINGGYGKIYGHLSYPIIAEWLQEYKETERAATVDARALERKAEASIKLSACDYEEGSVIDQLVKAFKVPPVEVPSEQPPAPTHEFLDGKYWGTFLASKKSYSDKDLQTFKDWATKGNFTKTLAEINLEIERRNATPTA